MNLNSCNPNHVEDRKKKRQLLEAEALRTIGSYLRDELSNIALPEWTTETLDELIEGKIEESQRIINALGTAELENEFAMQRHGEKAVAELRMDVHRRIAEGRFSPKGQ